MELAHIGVFGGSGFYSLGDDIEEIKIDTPYGRPSSSLFLATINGKRVAFMPRHGVDHIYPPHEINYRANVWAMKNIGVRFLFGPCAAGSLQKHVKPGDFVFCDQFIDRTQGRKDTFYDGPITTHVSAANPFCPTLRERAIASAKQLNITAHKTGTIVVINGPRFSSKAESMWYSKMGWEVINMTNYPESILARELEMCYLNISLITDYDCGLEGQVAHSTINEIMDIFNNNLGKVKTLLFDLIEKLDTESSCSCHSVLSASRFND